MICKGCGKWVENDCKKCSACGGTEFNEVSMKQIVVPIVGMILFALAIVGGVYIVSLI